MQFQDGQTKVIGGVTYTRTGGQWVAGGAPAAAAPAAGPIMGPPPLPKEPPAPQRPEVRDIDGKPFLVDPNTATATPITGADPANDPDAAVKKAIKGLGVENLLANLDNAERNLNEGGATGMESWIGDLWRGSNRKDFVGNLEGIKGQIVLEAMQNLKAAAANGSSGLGALSEKEGDRLAASVAALNADMSEDELRRSFAAIRQYARNLQMMANGQWGAQTPEGVMQAANMGIDAAGQIAAQTGLAPTDPTEAAARGPGDLVDNRRTEFQWGGAITPDEVKGERLSPEQEAALQEFLKTGPSGEQIQQWFVQNTPFNQGIADPDKIAEANQQGRLGAGINYSRSDEAYMDRVRARAGDLNRTVGRAGLTDRMMQGATLGLTDELTGVVGAGRALLTGEDVGDAYSVDRDAERLRLDQSRESDGILGTVAEIAGGVGSLNPSSLARLAPMTARQAAGQGARVGALGGFGYGEGTEGSIAGAATGAAFGGALGGVTQGVVNRMGGNVQGPPAPRPEALRARDVARAAEAENVPLRAPMVDPSSRAKAGALEASATGNTIRVAMDETTDAIEAGVNRLGQGGNVLNTDAAGNVVQNAARRFISSSRGTADRLYNRARALAGNATVTPRESLAQLRREMMDLRAAPNTNQGELQFINEIGEDLTAGPMTVDAIRSLRSSVRGRIVEKNLTATQAEARAMRIIDAIQQDVATSLPAPAAQAFRRADSYYRERMVHIDDVLDRFLGGNVERGVARLSGEKAFARLKAMASPGGDGRRLAAMMRNMDPNERRDIAATIAQSLGRAGPDEGFSAARFVTMAKDLSPSARRTIFGPDGAQSIENLTVLSRALRDSMKDMNTSRTAPSMLRNMATPIKSAISGLLAGGGAFAGGVEGAAAGAILAGTAIGANTAAKNLSARALMSPRLTRWMVEAMQIPPQRVPQHMSKLARIAQREPALANDIGLIQSRMGSTAAASENEGMPDE